LVKKKTIKIKNNMKNKYKAVLRSEIKKKNNDRVFNFILNFFLKNGMMPTLQEIGEEFNFTRERARMISERLVEEKRLIKGKEKKQDKHLL